MLRFLFASAPGALVWGALGLVLVFSLPPDPIGYVGGACMILAPVVGVVAIARGPTVATIIAAVLATLPLALFAVTLWILANDPS